MSGSNGIENVALVNREQELGTVQPFNVKGPKVQSYRDPSPALPNVSYPGNIISTTQVPSTNPSPTNLTPQQFYATLYFDAGTTSANTINAPTLSSFLTYLAQFHRLGQVMTVTLHWVNLKAVAPGGFVVINFPDPAWGVSNGSIGVNPQSVADVTFTIIGANAPATATSLGGNTTFQTVEPNFEVKTDLNGISGPAFIIRDVSTGITLATTVNGNWNEASINNTALGWGNAVRAAAGFRDSQLLSTIASLGAVSGAIGNTGGGYHVQYVTTGSPPLNQVVYYVKQDGVMRATLNANAAYTTAVLFDPTTGEFGKAVSSNRYKNTILDADEGHMSFFDNVHPRTFKYNDDPSNKVMLGLIAEELDAILPADLKVGILEYETIDGAQVVSGINYQSFVAGIAANQKRLNDKIVAQAVLITALTTRVTALEAH